MKKEDSLIGKVVVSKTKYCRFKSYSSCFLFLLKLFLKNNFNKELFERNFLKSPKRKNINNIHIII